MGREESMILNRYCRECNTATPQKYIGIEVRKNGNINLYKCIYCDSVGRVAEHKSPLEHNLTESKLREARENEI